MKENISVQSPLEATIAQTLRIADAIDEMSIRHDIVRDTHDRPVAVHVPGLVHVGVVEALATSAANILLVNKDANMQVHDEPTMFPRSRLTGRPYPILLGGLIHEAATAAFDKPGFDCDDLQTVEEGRGDGVPHIDLMERLEHPSAEELGLNVHVSLAGEGTFRGAFIPDFAAVQKLAEGIQACYREVVREATTEADGGANINDCIIRVRRELIRAHRIMSAGVEGVIHPALKAGAIILHTALQEATPLVKLSPGDVLIFQATANQARNCLPIVHDFRTTPTSSSRWYTVFRPRIISEDALTQEDRGDDASQYVVDNLLSAGAIQAPNIPQQPYRF